MGQGRDNGGKRSNANGFYTCLSAFNFRK
jgi:hypothetical protein